MIVRPDDDVYVVDQRWYGPPGRELPWHARYAAYGWGFLLYLLAMLVERVVLRLDVSFTSLVFTLLAVCLVTSYVMRRTDPDRPVLQVLRGYWHELKSPRPSTDSAGPKPARARIRLARPARSSVPDAFAARVATDLHCT